MGSLKPLAPVHVTRSDDADGNSQIEWSHRARLGHGLHGGLSGFDDRETINFELDIFADAGRSAVLRTLRPSSNITMPIEFPQVSGTLTPPSGGSVVGNTVTGPAYAGSPEAFVRALSRAVLNEPGAFVEFTPIPPGTNDASNGLLVELYPNETAPAFGEYAIQITLFSDETKVSDLAGTTTAATAADVVGRRVRIVTEDDGVYFYADYGTAQQTLLHVSHQIPHFPYKVRVTAYDAGGTLSFPQTYKAEDVRVSSNRYGTVYSAAQKAADGLAPGGTLYLDIYQLDPRVGRGYPARVTLAAP